MEVRGQTFRNRFSPFTLYGYWGLSATSQALQQVLVPLSHLTGTGGDFEHSFYILKSTQDTTILH